VAPSGPGRTARSDIQQVAFQRPPLAGTHVLARRPLPLTVPADPEARKAALVDEYSRKYANPYIAAERGIVDAVIDPAETRQKVIAAFDMIGAKREELPRRKHGNVPL